MSLTKFKSDPTKATVGVWVEYPANKDGTIPRFRLARMNKQNRAYSKALRKSSEKFTADKGVLDFDAIPEKEAEDMLLNVFVTTILLGWENVQPEDDGKSIDFNENNAKLLLGDPAWVDLYDDLQAKAGNIARYRQEILEAEAKNS